MIAVISMYNKKLKGVQATCVINASGDVIVDEIEAILTSLYQQQPNEFIKATDYMMERLDAKNNSNN